MRSKKDDLKNGIKAKEMFNETALGTYLNDGIKKGEIEDMEYEIHSLEDLHDSKRKSFTTGLMIGSMGTALMTTIIASVQAYRKSKK